MKKNLFVRFAVDEDAVEALQEILGVLIESESDENALFDLQQIITRVGLPVVHGASMKVVDYNMDGKKGFMQPGRL